MKSILTFPASAVIAALSVLTAVLAPACSSTPANPLATVGGFCEAKAKAECQLTAVCAIDPPTCLDFRQSLCLTQAQAATASGGRLYTPGNAQACIDALNNAYGNMKTTVLFAQLEGPGSITDLCDRVFSGNVVVNEACASDDECANSAICAPRTPGSTSKVCAPIIAVSLSGFCDNPGSTCATDTYCDSTLGQCTPSAALGQVCSTAVPCVSAAQCVGGACVARETIGGGCTSDSQCGSAGPYCDPADSLCSIGLTFAAKSADCNAFIAEDAGGPAVATPVVDAAAPGVDSATTATPTVDASAADAAGE